MTLQMEISRLFPLALMNKKSRQGLVANSISSSSRSVLLVLLSRIKVVFSSYIYSRFMVDFFNSFTN